MAVPLRLYVVAPIAAFTKIVPFETTPRPKGLDKYLTWMQKQGDTPNEYTTYGWINAAMLVEGIRAHRDVSPAAARAQDASTLFTNPAGMSLLQGTEFHGGLQALYGSVSFTADAHTSPGLGTNNGDNAIGWLPASLSE